MNDEPAPVDVKRVSWWPPSWLVLTAVAATILTVIAVAVAWYEIADERGERREECLQTVAFRRENRAMWLELFEAFPEAAVETGLRDDLETLLPPLRCDGATPVPDLGGTPP
jgi:hypothetical protein